MGTAVECTCGSGLQPCVCELRERCYSAGRLIGSVPPGIRFYLLGGSVYCVRSHTQVDYSGTLAAFVGADNQRADRGEKRILRQFFYYDAGKVGLAIDPARPWQVCSDIGVLLAKLPSENMAKAAVAALIADHFAGTLPCDLSKWEKRGLLG